MQFTQHRFWFVFCLFLFSLAQNISHAQTDGNKIALVIGNTEYTQLPRLKNAAADALSVAQALSDKGFTVFFASNVNAAKLKETLAFVSTQAAHADQILVYYAGHNEIRNGATHLLSIDSKGGSQPFDTSSLSVPELLGYFDIPFAQKAIILDTCLQNPPEISGTNAQNLSLPKALGLETLLVFATSFGQAAYDGTGDHSVFTGALLDYMTKEKFDLQSTIKAVRREVIQGSRAHQIPVSVSTLTRPYILSTDLFTPQNFRSQNNLIQSYSSSGYAGKPLLDTIALGINPTGF